MNTEENIAPEVKELLDALAEPHANQLRQQQLGELIDRLAAQEKPITAQRNRNKHLWKWAGIAAAAACVVLFIIRLPDNNTPVATDNAVASIDVPLPQITANEETIDIQPATPVKQAKQRSHTLLAQAQTVDATEIMETVTVDKPTETISTTDETVMPDPIVVQETPIPTKPTQRVVACNKLVCYDCKHKDNVANKQRMSDKTIFGTPATTNMDEGMLMLASI